MHGEKINISVYENTQTTFLGNIPPPTPPQTKIPKIAIYPPPLLAPVL